MKLFAVMGQYWENGVNVIAANDAAEALTLRRAEDADVPPNMLEELTAEEIAGASADGPPRILW